MWYSENERIGFRTCTPIGYFARALTDLFGLCVFIMLIAVPLLLTRELFKGAFQISHLWLLAAPFTLWIADPALHRFARILAGRKRFRYDYDLNIASWIEEGERRTYPHETNGEATRCTP